MAPPFQRVLVPIDGSDDARKALEVATALASRTEGATITLVHVVDVFPFESMRTVDAQPGGAQLSERVFMAGRKLLNDGEAWVKGHGLTVSSVLKEGIVVEQLVDVAKQTKADLIVMGSKGRTGLTKMFIGSVAQGVSSRAPCAVMVVR